MTEPVPAASAIFLSEEPSELQEGAGFLTRLGPESLARLHAAGSEIHLGRGAAVFHQGDSHNGIWLIRDGTVRAFYVSPAGREITLALWTAGHFIGGPEVFGRGTHIWSADVLEPARLLFITGGRIRQLAESLPDFAICLIEQLVAKGKCYSALVQMLGTRSIAQRLAHILVILADTSATRDGNRLVITRKITHDQLAAIVGATRQWVTATLDRFQRRGIISVSRQHLVIENYDMLISLTDE